MSSILSGDFEVKVDTAYLKKSGFLCIWPTEKLATRFVNGVKSMIFNDSMCFTEAQKCGRT